MDALVLAAVKAWKKPWTVRGSPVQRRIAIDASGM